MALIFLSDVHLTGNSDPRTRAFVSLLASLKAGDECVIGGDLFDLFVGNKAAFKEIHGAALGAIFSAARRGCKIQYFEGNHDFHMTKVFAGFENISVFTDAAWHQISDEKIHIAHGDRIDPEDYGYHFLRFITRSWPCRLLLWLLPDFLVRTIGEWSSKQSRKYNDLSAQAASSLRLKRTRDLFIDYARERAKEGARWILLGHSHIADQFPLEIDGKKAEYLNMGYAANGLRYAEIKADGDVARLKASVKNIPAP